MHACMHMCVCARVCVCGAHVHRCVSACAHVCLWACAYVCMRAACVPVRMCICLHACCMCGYVHTGACVPHACMCACYVCMCACVDFRSGHSCAPALGLSLQDGSDEDDYWTQQRFAKLKPPRAGPNQPASRSPPELKVRVLDVSFPLRGCIHVGLQRCIDTYVCLRAQCFPIVRS